MSATLAASMRLLDGIRARFLRLTTRSPFLLELFQNRARRLAALFALSCMISLLLATILPLWLLLLGPLVYGVPHLFASLRYFHYLLGGKPGVRPDPAGQRRSRRILLVATPLFVAIIAYRLLVNLNLAGALGISSVAQLSEWAGSTYLEIGGLAVALAAGALVYRVGFRQAAGAAMILAPLAAGFALSPIWTVGALVMIHNFVAYGYWIQAAETPEEKSVAWGGFAVALAVTCAILSGGLDPAFRHFRPTLALDFAGLTAREMAQLILPSLDGETLWLRLSSAFAFGQALHYFVWLKAIPDQFHYHEVPTSFRQALKLLERDFTRIGAIAAIGITAGSLVLWAFLSLRMARFTYFAIASFHGYFEIAGLALAWRPLSSPARAPVAVVEIAGSRGI